MDVVRYAGPADGRLLPHDELEGYQPITRLGEVVINACIDDTAYDEQHHGHWYQWASVLPGMIAVNKADGPHTPPYGAESTMQVIVCAEGKKESDENQFVFAGITRTKSVLSPDDGLGPKVDEPFTISIKGCANILNNGADIIAPGTIVAWCFAGTSKPTVKRQKVSSSNAHSIAIKRADTYMDRNVIGRALSYAKPGDRLDILIM